VTSFGEVEEPPPPPVLPREGKGTAPGGVLSETSSPKSLNVIVNDECSLCSFVLRVPLSE
jgi:hypothetical protein